MSSVLVVKNDGAGDLIISSGIITGLANQLGPVDLVTCSQNREIAEGIEGVSKVHFVSRDSMRLSGPLKRIGIYWPIMSASDRAVVNQIRSRQYSTAIVLRRFIRESSLILMRHINARTKICGWQFPTNATLNFAKKCSRGWQHFRGASLPIHETAYYYEMIQSSLNVSVNCQPSLGFCSMSEPNRQTGKVGLIIGGASTNWPEPYWIQLVKFLIDEGFSVTIFGGPAEQVLADAIRFHYPSVNSLVGKLSWKESPEKLGQFEIVIGNDTGLTHLATLSVQKVIVILGGGTFRRFFPWPGAKNQFIIYSALECFDCDWQCKYSRKHCMDAVTPADVYQFLQDIIQNEHVERTRNLNPIPSTYQVGWRRSDANSVGQLRDVVNS